MVKVAVFAVIIVKILHFGVVHPSGAPTIACSTFRPIRGSSTLPQSSPCPYKVDLSQFAFASSFVYIPGRQYNITLQSSSSTTPFKGFLLQARSVNNSANIRGTFSKIPNGAQYISCSVSYPMASVTHNNTNGKDYHSLMFTWTAPAANSGPLRFEFTVVQTYNTFWSEITSYIIQENTNGFLLLANGVDIKTLNLDGSSLKTLTSNAINVVDTDFHYRNNHLYWLDYTHTPNIRRSSLDGARNVITIAQNNLITPSSVAVDWINDKLYWCDENASRIEVAELSGSNRKVLLDTDILYPRDLVIDPNSGYMYWVDWGFGKIERASLDGTSRQVIHRGLNTPVGLTIDYQTQILYWIDSTNTVHKLESSSVDGSNRQTLLTSSNLLDDLTMLNNKLYWTERRAKNVYSTNINDPQNYQILLSGLKYQPKSVEAVHPLRQAKAPNPCEVNNGGCQQLCLLSASSSSGYSCACADGFLPAIHDSSQCKAASTYKVTFCLSGVSDCNSWTTDQLEDAKMFKITQAMVAGVRSLCTKCTNTFTSGNLHSTQKSTFICQTYNNNLVKFHGYIYGYSHIDDAPLLSAIHQWKNDKPFIRVFEDQLQVDSDERCDSARLSNTKLAGSEYSTSSDTDSDDSESLSTADKVGIVFANIFFWGFLLCLCCCCVICIPLCNAANGN